MSRSVCSLSGSKYADRQGLRNLQLERRLQDVGLRGLQVSTALVAVNASRCVPDLELSRNRTKNVASRPHCIHGCMRLIDVSTGRVILTEPLSGSVRESNDGCKGYPDYPPTAEAGRKVLDVAVEKVSAVLTTTRPKSGLLFFNDKACGLKAGHRLVVGGDIEGALHCLQESLESCKVTSAKKTGLLARAHPNVEVLQIMRGDHESARGNLRSKAQLHDGPYIKQALELSIKARASAARMPQVEARTKEMSERRIVAQGVSGPGGAGRLY